MPLLLLGDPFCSLPTVRAPELEHLSLMIEKCLFLVFSSVFCDAQHIWRWTWSICQGRKDLEAEAVSAVQENQECGSAKVCRGGQMMCHGGEECWAAVSAGGLGRAEGCWMLCSHPAAVRVCHNNARCCPPGSAA